MSGGSVQDKANKFKFIAAFFLRRNYCLREAKLTKITMITGMQCFRLAKITKNTRTSQSLLAKVSFVITKCFSQHA